MKITNNCPFKITVLTLYKEAFPGYLSLSLAKKAMEKNIWSLDVINIRDFAIDKYKKVDDKVFGGGKGLLLKPDILSDAIEFAFKKGASKNLFYPSPRGKVFNQSLAKDFAGYDGMTFICGHFEGVDERILEYYKPREISIGDYILSGGEISSMIIIDSVLRLLPNVLNSVECITEESFESNLLEYPQYTKPYLWKDKAVPDILLSGNHEKIKQWRLKKSIEKTKEIRPDLLDKYCKDMS